MGRERPEILRVNPNTLKGRGFPCFAEMMAFMSCMKMANFSDEPCVAEKAALNSCIELAVSFLFAHLFKHERVGLLLLERFDLEHTLLPCLYFRVSRMT